MGSEVSFAGQDLSIRRGGVGNCNAGNADRVHEQKDNPVPKALAELRGNDDTNGISDEWYGLETFVGTNNCTSHQDEWQPTRHGLSGVEDTTLEPIGKHADAQGKRRQEHIRAEMAHEHHIANLHETKHFGGVFKRTTGGTACWKSTVDVPFASLSRRS
ncbi:hypothetical protein MGG_17605 [Pyricularia oryzae 70-15]|uniref:Uncharacterized protein n=3 Tax=Pyricularia oryzae TaxID=318829 RepID=G4NG50_PYRO7|nr:uncharacterized protein MGG_17605 [Pyricularia oryzae 70-15]EHA47007.1 hypothetical protein MGG_17605 [Pyricularia oryzae 70-15]ELQ32814.1 hypothetical protein OOU_Y34scaffold01031g10 [Pyricularia oryzae Y34]